MCGTIDTDLKNFVWDLGKEGFVLQLISLAGLHSNATATGEWHLRSQSTATKRILCSGTGGTLQDGRHARIRGARTAEREGDRMRRADAPKMVGFRFPTAHFNEC